MNCSAKPFTDFILLAFLTSSSLFSESEHAHIMGVRQTGVGIDGDLISRRLIYIDLDQRVQVLDLDPGDLLHLALLHKSGHLSVVGDGLFL